MYNVHNIILDYLPSRGPGTNESNNRLNYHYPCFCSLVNYIGIHSYYRGGFKVLTHAKIAISTHQVGAKMGKSTRPI